MPAILLMVMLYWLHVPPQPVTEVGPASPGNPSGFTTTSGVAYNVKIATRDGAVFSYRCVAG